MDIEIHSRHVEIAEEIKFAARRKTERLGRYLTGVERADVFFSDGQPGKTAHGMGQTRHLVDLNQRREGDCHPLKSVVAVVGSLAQMCSAKPSPKNSEAVTVH